MGPTTQNGDVVHKRRVYYSGSDTLLAGMNLCYDYTATETIGNERAFTVAKPSIVNALRYAGCVAEGQNRRGAGFVELIDPGMGPRHGVPVSTNMNCAVGDLLGVIPGSYYLGPAVIGAPIAEVITAVDRSSTAGLVRTAFGLDANTARIQMDGRLVRHFDHFIGDRTISAPAVANAVADAGTYLLTGTSAAAAFVDSLNAEVAAAARAAGALAITSNTTNAANITMNGEPWGLASGQAILFRTRVKLDAVAAATGAIGLSLTDTAVLASLPTDYIFFKIAAGTITLEYVKDGTTGAVSAAVGSVAADTWVDLAFLCVNRGGSSKMDLYIFQDGVQISHTVTGTEIVDNESLTFFAEVVGSAAAKVLTIDRVEINNWVASAA